MNKDKKAKILFIDDDQFILDMYSRKLSSSGFEVFPFFSAYDALEKLKEGFTPDLILVDIIMPQMNGIEFLQELRAQNLAPSAKVVLLTNQNEQENIEEAKRLQVDKYIIKANVIPSELVNIIKSMCKK